MKLHRVPEALVPKLPLGKIIKYIKKTDETMTPKTGIVLKHPDETTWILKGLGGPSIWSIKCKENVCYVTKDILDTIRPKPKPKNKIKTNVKSKSTKSKTKSNNKNKN